MIPLPPNDVLQLRSIKKTAVLLLLLIRLQGQPVTARDMADTLEMDYQTVRNHLASLRALGLALESEQGWSVGGGALQLSTGYPQVAVESARISRLEAKESPHSSTSVYSPQLEEEEEELTEREILALDELERQGLHVNRRLEDIVRNNEYIDARYVEHHADRLRRENRFSNGLLIRVLMDGDPVSTEATRQRSKRYYTSM